MTTKDRARVAEQWWRETIWSDSPNRDRAAAAALRHANSVLDAAEEPVTIDLVRRWHGRARDLEDAALCAAVLAHVRENEPLPVARRIGRPTDPDARPAMSPLRFRRLLQADSADERLVQFRRLAAFTGGTLNVADLVAALIDWSEHRKREWVFRYHLGEPPEEETTSQPDPEGATP